MRRSPGRAGARRVRRTPARAQGAGQQRCWRVLASTPLGISFVTLNPRNPPRTLPNDATMTATGTVRKSAPVRMATVPTVFPQDVVGTRSAAEGRGEAEW